MICETVRSASMLARMCMGSAQAQPLFPTPCIDAVVTLSDQHPSVPFDRPPEKAVCLTECLWCLPTKPFPRATHPLVHNPPPHRSLVFCDTPVTSARRPSNNPHRPLPTANPTLASTYWELEGIRKEESAFSFPSFLLPLSSAFFLPPFPPPASLFFAPRASTSTPSWLSLSLSYRVMTGDHEIPGISRGRSSEIRSGTIRTIFLPDNEGLSTWKKIRVKEMIRNAVIATFERFLIYDCLIVLSRIFFFFLFFVDSEIFVIIFRYHLFQRTSHYDQYNSKLRFKVICMKYYTKRSSVASITSLSL